MVGMGGAFTALDGEVGGIYSNPASLSTISSPCLGVTHTTIFGMEELGYSNIIFSTPIGGFGRAGIGIGQFGGSIYREMEFTVSLARMLLKRTSIGTNLKYMELDIPTVGRRGSLGVDLGILHKMTDRVWSGLFFSNLNSPKIIEPIPRRIVLGVAVRPISRMVVALDHGLLITPHLDHRSSWMAGLEFGLTGEIFIRCGLRTTPLRQGLGFGIDTGWGRIDYGYLAHGVLGGTHGVTIIFGKCQGH